MMGKNFAIIVIFVLLAVACSKQEQIQELPKDTQKSYKIGIIAPLTGDESVYGGPIKKAIDIAIGEINAKGGVNGKMLEAIYEDGKCSPEESLAATQKLIDTDNVKVIIGGICSGETLGAAPLAETKKILMISPSSTSPEITKAGDYIFRVAGSDAYSGAAASDYSFKYLKAKKAAVITEDTDYAKGLGKSFSEEFVRIGGEIVSDETYTKEEESLKSRAERVKTAAPDMVYVVSQSPQKAIFVLEQLNQSGIRAKMFAAELPRDNEFIAKNRRQLEKVYGTRQRFDEKNKKVENMISKYEEQNEEDAAFQEYIANAYDIVYILANGIGKEGYDSELLKNYMYTIKDYEGASGKITIDDNGDTLREYEIIQVKNGTVVMLNNK